MSGPPIKRNPAGAGGGARKSDRDGERVYGRDTAARPDTQEAPVIETDHDHSSPRIISVYNGRDLLGHVAIARSIRAITPDNIEIGTFDTQEEARAAVVRHAFAGTSE